MGVDLRRWQRYEADGTTKWKTAEWIAEILGVSAELIMTGEEGTKTPADLESRLAHLESQVAEVLRRLKVQDAIEGARQKQRQRSERRP